MHMLWGEERVGIRIELVPSWDDPPKPDTGYQNELTDLDHALNDVEVDYNRTILSPHSAQGFDYALGEYLIRYVAPAAFSAVAGAFCAWLQARSGRKVRLKIGDIEAEANSVRDAEHLLVQAMTLQAQKVDDEV
ncbi:hypothetical protein SXCC_01876 [Gluconacetobacter sp. SXCC-1]|nr:hypothetical protein SXCC_01876 [Gluconacetobacter sp. SXCC-1]